MKGAICRALLALAVALLSPPASNAMPQKTVHYYHQHPIPYYLGGGFCYKKGPHVHFYDPQTMPFFVQVGHAYYFVGDPVFEGYVGKVYYYFDRHPLDASHGGGICYIRGPHRHVFAPPSKRTPLGPYFRVEAGYYRYRGPQQPNVEPTRVDDLHAYYVLPRYRTLHLQMTYRPRQPVAVIGVRDYPVGFHVHVHVGGPPPVIIRGPRVEFFLGTRVYRGPRRVEHRHIEYRRYKYKHKHYKYKHKHFKHKHFKHKHFKHKHKQKHRGRW